MGAPALPLTDRAPDDRPQSARDGGSEMACHTPSSFYPPTTGLASAPAYFAQAFPASFFHTPPYMGGGMTAEAGDSSAVSTTADVVDFSDSDSDTSSKQPSQSDDRPPKLNRKRRRGIIEKRRRDRINACLGELRRLVPAAFERQGSQKLEKAEILQLTVQHLTHLQTKGVDAVIREPERYSADYQSMGFRECASEVARYLSAIEGMDIQDPLRMRLMSHLQCYSAQKAATAPTGGGYDEYSAYAASSSSIFPTPPQEPHSSHLQSSGFPRVSSSTLHMEEEPSF